jgi:hypothetical protein
MTTTIASVDVGGTGVTTSTGSGSNVLNNSPAFTGTTSATGLTISTGGGTNIANTLAIDTDGAGTARYYSHGGNTTTPGAHAWHISSSNGSIDTIGMYLNSTGNVGIGTTSTSNLGINTKFVTAGNSGGLSAFGSVTGSGTGAIDTGIPINQEGNGGTVLFIASSNYGAATNTKSAVYFLKFYYDGNNAPTATGIAGDTTNYTFGVSGSNTLTVINTSSGNVVYSWFGNK